MIKRRKLLLKQVAWIHPKDFDKYNCEFFSKNKFHEFNIFYYTNVNLLFASYLLEYYNFCGKLTKNIASKISQKNDLNFKLKLHKSTK